MSEQHESWEQAAEWCDLGVDPDAAQPHSGETEQVFRSFREACEWSRENAGRAFTRCDDSDDFRPVHGSEAYLASQSWHAFEELYLDGPYRNEMG